MGSAIKEGDAEGLIKLSDKICQCEVTFQVGLGSREIPIPKSRDFSLFLPIPIPGLFVAKSRDYRCFRITAMYGWL